MLNTYDVHYEYYVNNELVRHICPCLQTNILEESEIKPKTKTYTWQDVTKYICFSDDAYGYTRRDKKYMMIYGKKYKMEKDPNLTFTIVTRYEKTKCSIKEILSYRDSDRAIQYLVERGLNVFDGLR